MHDTRVGSPLHRGWQRLLDGERPWGSIDVHPDRFGMTRYRLVVFPPGISESERRRVRLARGWPMWGALVWVTCEVLLTQVTGPWTALALSTATVIVAGLIVTSMSGTQRAQVKTMAAVVNAGYHDPQSEARRDKLGRLALMLIDADERLGHGEISAADHELTWWRVYDEVGSGRSG
jgi:hypothetical protein